MKTRVLLSLLALSGIAHAQTVPAPTVITPEQQAPFFPDVPPGHWAFAAVQKLAGAGIVQGFPKTSGSTQVTGLPAPRVGILDREKVRDAATLTPKTKAALSANPGLKGTLINVDTNSQFSTLTLRGTVKTEAQKQLAFAIARKSAPTFKVVNQLRVSR